MADPRTPPPGSDEAVGQGCRCPRYDNRRGEGHYIEPMFVIRDECPLHGVARNLSTTSPPTRDSFP